MKTLIPRLSSAQSFERFAEIQGSLKEGAALADLVQISIGDAIPNATGGSAPSSVVLATWRTEVIGRVEPFSSNGQIPHAVYSRELGRALEEVIEPSRSDASHDGTWSFLSLVLFPDLVGRRWGPNKNGDLSADRWIGAQSGRDRNFLKLCWRNWNALGEVMEESGIPLGEDEHVALLERSSLARNRRLTLIAARNIMNLDPSHGIARTDYARNLMKRITFQTGPLVLDLLDDDELETLVEEQSELTISSFTRLLS